jgi:hypothetical protein
LILCKKKGKKKKEKNDENRSRKNEQVGWEAGRKAAFLKRQVNA